jgi:cysteine desulfurase/selenocysteine lyase
MAIRWPVRQRLDHAQAAGCHRPPASLLPARKLQHPPRRPCPGRTRHRCRGARATVQRFINAPEAAEVIFVRGATEAINLVARSWGAQNVHAGDEIIVSHLEHHANIVPWQQLAASVGATLRVIPVDDSGQLRIDVYADC